MLTIQKAALSDIEEIVPKLRYADLLEIDAMTAKTPLDVLGAGYVNSSGVWVGRTDDEILCVFGIIDLENGVGSPWMVGTDMIESVSIGFLRASRDVFFEHTKDYHLLGNMVDCRNVTHIQWIEWLGFTMGHVELVGPFDLPFQHFYWIKTDV